MHKGRADFWTMILGEISGTGAYFDSRWLVHHDRNGMCSAQADMHMTRG
jgi:hypothetical protein